MSYVRFDDSQTAGEKTPPKFRAEVETLVAGYGGSGITPESFGALGNGASDDTAAMQDWINEIQLGNRYGVLTPGKTYLIEDELVIDTAASGWIIEGRGATIQQNTDGKHIFHFTVENVRNFQVRNMRVMWTNAQDYTDNTAAFYFEQTTDSYYGWYGWTISNVSMYNGYQGIRTRDDDTHVNIVWDCTIDRWRSEYGCSGTAVKLANGRAGQTSVRVDAYQHRETSAEPVVRIVVADHLQLNVRMDGENQTAHHGIELEHVYAANICGRQERGNLGDGQGVVWINHGRGIHVSDFSFQAIQSFTGAAQAGFLLEDTKAFTLAGGALTTYNPNPDFPATFAVVDWDDDSTVDRVSCALSGAALLTRPNLPSSSIEANSVTPAMLYVSDGSVPGLNKVYEDGRWVTMTSGGGSSTSGIRKQTIMALGDSLSAIISAYNAASGTDLHLGASAGHGPGDYLFLANTLEGSPLDVLGAAATAGYTAQQIRDVHLPTVLVAKPEYCICWSLGANNWLASGEGAQSIYDIANYILGQLISNGITPILPTMPPANSSGLSQNEVARYNSWVGAWCRKGVLMLDFYAALVDPATGFYKAGYTSDNLHPGVVGSAALVAPTRALIAKISAGVSQAVLAATNATITGQMSNPLLAGTIGANHPTGWSLGASATPALGASATYPGNEYTITATGSLGYVNGPTLAGAAGNEWELSFRWETTPQAGGGWALALYDQSGNVAHMWGSTSLANPTQLSLSKPFHARGKFLSGDTSLRPTLFVYGSGSVAKVAQFTFRNLSAMSISIPA